MMITSPCRQICQLDVHGMCIGCLRTAKEIEHWLLYSAQQQQALLEQLSERRTEQAVATK